ncbi:uncharacterized protein ASPGLDRAFT_1393972 [Aspergillus glaucus CBS 516.65]|uniref:Uncharacterized protein n=1 Tax=Aspergillus glaucus CBS 516.65 TaxID=1160497 RepID=A0A1L9V3K0_ASPGL|nr:hypothetical protein ASPGLDRAFT_1393972 [Aspergillus glaucus CBS 516.65]OJJ78409.1 hypothetical protein ASPGLDRAFT_1393972 [Aspergillus glaucus CBS 516.65]
MSCCNWDSIGVCCNNHCRSVRPCSASISHGDRLAWPNALSAPPSSLDTNPKNLCQSVLLSRNISRRWAVVPGCSMIPRPYTMPATWDECAACKSAICPIHSSAPIPLSASASSCGLGQSLCMLLGNTLDGRIYRRLMPMAISRYAGKFNAWPWSPAVVSRFKSSRSRSDDHSRLVLGSGGHKNARRWPLWMVSYCSDLDLIHHQQFTVNIHCQHSLSTFTVNIHCQHSLINDSPYQLLSFPSICRIFC